MGEPVRILCSDGSIETDQCLDQILTGHNHVINFESSADGRGFSLAKAWLRDEARNQRLYMSGLNPDQVSLAFQVGVDGVIVSEEDWHDYGGEIWKSVLQPVVSVSYAKTDSSALQSIWDTRQNADSRTLAPKPPIG